MIKMAEIQWEDICLSYKNKMVLHHLHLTIEKGDYFVLCGKNGSGKSSLIKTMLHLVKYEGKVTIFGKEMHEENRNSLLEDISVVFENPNTNLVCETVFDELKFPLKNKRPQKLDYHKEIEAFAKTLGIENMLSLSTNTLSGGEKQLISFAAAMITKPKILILDEPFTMVDGITKEKLMKYIKKYYKETKCTILHVTHDVEDILYGNKVGLMQEGQIIHSLAKEELLLDDKRMKQIGFPLPFLADLSLKLKYYGLMDEPILDMNKMVKYLWK